MALLLDPDIKKILCDRQVAALANAIADLVPGGAFTKDQLSKMTELDEEWIDATWKVLNERALP